jgi:hypothetical protein
MNNLGIGTSQKVTGYRAGYWSNIFSLGYNNSESTKPTLPVRSNYQVTVAKINHRYYFQIDGVVAPPLCLVRGRSYQFIFKPNPDRPCLLQFSDTNGLVTTYSVDGQLVKATNLWNRIRNGELFSDIKITVTINNTPELTRANYYCRGAGTGGNWINITDITDVVGGCLVGTR